LGEGFAREMDCFIGFMSLVGRVFHIVPPRNCFSI
jgi:hypothetical protein